MWPHCPGTIRPQFARIFILNSYLLCEHVSFYPPLKMNVKKNLLFDEYRRGGMRSLNFSARNEHF